MKPFVHIKFDDATYQVVTQVIAEHRAQYMTENVSNEYPSLEDALAATNKLFEVEDEIRHWAVNNMTWSDLACGALMMASHSERRLEDAQWTYAEAPIMPEEPLGKVVDDIPAGLILSRMLTRGEMCHVMTVGPEEAPTTALVTIQSADPQVVQAYIAVLHQLTEQIKQFPNGIAPQIATPEKRIITLN